MKSVQHQLTEWMTAAISQLGIELDVPIAFDYPAEPSHGHYASSWAMQAFGQLKPQLSSIKSPDPISSPRDLAAVIAKTLPLVPGFSPDVVAKVEVAGPGFLNIFLEPGFLQQQVAASAEHPPLIEDLPGERLIIEFTDPNPFKEFHIGHLYSNIVGESLAKLSETRGIEVRRVCYQGDVGMHVAKSIWGLEQLLAQRFPELPQDQVLSELEQEELSARIKLLGQAYAAGATAYEADPKAQQQIKDINLLTFASAQQQLVSETGWQPQVDYQELTTLDESRLTVVKQLYSVGRAWSLEYFNQMYSRAGMQFDDFFFESLVGEYGMQTVRQHLKTADNPNGVFEESQGAVIFPGSKYGLHDRVFINSLGLPTYEAKELGLAPEKYRRWQYDHSVIVTGNEIDEYFKVLLKAMSLTHPELAAKTRHISHGMVKLPQGKMSSRTGKIITAEWLMNEAQNRILAQLEQQRPEMSPEMRLQIADQVAMGAIKYAFLRSGVGRDIAFDFDESLSLSGNSGPYIQYMAVRCGSILQKAGPEALNIAVDQLSSDQNSTALNPEEQLLALLLVRQPEVIWRAAQDLSPHLLASHIYALAQAFSVFYDRHQVIGQPQRVVLTAAVQKALEQGLRLLGIAVPDKM